MRRDQFCQLLAWAVIAVSWGPVGSVWGTEDVQPPKTAVTMVVDYGDGVQKHFTAIAWQKGMTVMDVIRYAQKHPRGIKVVHRGKGATAFLSKIDDLENEGNGRNWIYRVNDKLADRSFAIFTVEPGDTILWRFGQYR